METTHDSIRLTTVGIAHLWIWKIPFDEIQPSGKIQRSEGKLFKGTKSG